MNEILIIAGLNALLIIGSLVFEYLRVINQRKQSDARLFKIDYLSQQNKNNMTIFFPGKLGNKIYTKFFVNKKVVQKETKPSLLKQITPANLALLNIALVVIAFNLQQIAGVPWYLSILVMAVGELLAFAFLKGKQVKVREAIEKKLPEILDMMARVYRVHNDLRVAVAEVAEHSGDPIVKQEFKKVAQLSRFGYSIEEALEYLSEEIKSEDLDFVISSIRLNAPVGGNLAYLFEHTAQMLRQRKDATDEISNLMFQSKISASISALLVPIIIILSFVSSPKYQDALLRNPNGRMVFLFCLVWWFIGVVIIRKNSRIAL